MFPVCLKYVTENAMKNLKASLKSNESLDYYHSDVSYLIICSLTVLSEFEYVILMILETALLL
jgi:hypothetical protein